MTQMDLTDTYRTFHSNTKEYFFSENLKEHSSKLTIYAVIKQVSVDTNCNNPMLPIKQPWIKAGFQQQNRNSRKLTNPNPCKLNNSLLYYH